MEVIRDRVAVQVEVELEVQVGDTTIGRYRRRSLAVIVYAEFGLCEIRLTWGGT